MTPLKTLLRHTSHYLGGRIALMLLGFASFPVFTRVFSVADYGALSLIQSMVLLLTVIAKFGFQHSVQRYYPEYAGSSDPLAVRRYYSTLFFGTGLISLLLTALFLGAVPLGLGRLLGTAAIGTMLVAASLIVIRALRSMQLNLMQMENKTKLFNATEIFQKAAGIGLTIALLFAWRKSIAACFIGMAVVEGVVLLQYIPVLTRRGLLSAALFDPGFFRAATVFSFPLMIAEISWVGLAAGDRFFITHYLGLVAVGYYAAACGIATYVQEVMTTPLQLSFFPICMKLWSAEGEAATQRFLSRSLNYFVMLSVLVVATATVTSKEVIVLLASKKFQDARSLLPYLVIGLALSAMNTFFRPGLMIHKRVRKIAQATFLGCMVNIALNVILDPKFGLHGAAWASVLSFLAMVTYSGYQSMQVLPFKIQWVATVRYIAVGVAAYCFALLVPVENPIAGAAIKAIAVLVFYASVLWMIDPYMREVTGHAKLAVARLMRRSREGVQDALTVAAER